MNGIFKIVSPNYFFISVTRGTHLSLYTCDKTTLKYIQLQGNCGRKSTIPVKEFIIHTHTHAKFVSMYCRKLVVSKILFGKTATATKLRTMTKMKRTKPK